jgi:hypothetical protein
MGGEVSVDKDGKATYRMPTNDAERQPSDDERKVLEQWILAGAPFPKAIGRTSPFIDDATTLTAIRNHLRDKVKAADRPFQRYITLVCLHNNPTVGDEAIRIHRAAVSKLLNSLSWQQEIAVPRPIDEGPRVILNVDLRAYGWEARDWNDVERAYPYGVLHSEDEVLLEVERERGRPGPIAVAGFRLSAGARSCVNDGERIEGRRPILAQRSKCPARIPPARR